VKPRFRYTDWNKKTILVVDASVYAGMNADPPNPDSVRNFYRDALASLPAGLCHSFAIWYDPKHSPDKFKNSPGEDRLSRFDLVILLNIGGTSAIFWADSIYDRYEEYLNIGGRVWLIGLNNFDVVTGKDKLRPAPSFAREYFGVDNVLAPGWSTLDSMTLEFIRAEPFGSWKDLPTLVPDTIKCQQLRNYTWYDPVRGPVYRFGTRGIPYVCFDALVNYTDFEDRYPAQRRIYTYRSYYGSASPLDGKPCAVTYVGPTYRTAEFTFPLNLMKNDAADGRPVFKVIEEMVNWFWKKLPQP
jgi:hypothetical protein